MTKPRILTAAVIGLALGIPGNLSSARAVASTPSNGGGNIIIAWNEALQGVLTPSPSNTRDFSILHIAIFDAVNAIERAYSPYRVRLRGLHGASPEAAAAQAGHDVLTALYPAQRGTFDALLESQLAGLPRGRALLGRFIGYRVAVEILEWRQNDGWAAPQPRVHAAAVSGAVAADAAGVQHRDFHPLSEHNAIRAAHAHAVSAASATDVDERALRDGLRRSEAPRIGHEHGAHRGADAPGAAG